MIKVVYIGTSIHCAEMILHNDKLHLTEVICEECRLSRELLTFCLARQIKLATVSNRSDVGTAISSHSKNTVFIMYAFGIRVPMEELEGYSVFNIHPSDLPLYRGAHPTYWATVNGEKKIGVTIFQITEKLDMGYLVAKDFVEYYLWENEADLGLKIMNTFPKLLDALVEYLGMEQKNCLTGAGDYYPKVGRKEVFIDLKNDSPALIVNKVRAEALFDGAKLTMSDKTFGLKCVLFEKGCLETEYDIVDAELKIRYTNDLILVSNDFSVLSEEFRFRNEK